MRMLAAVLFLAATPVLADAPAAPPHAFPIPQVSKMPPATPGQRVFRLPMRFARVEAFYREQFGGDRRVQLTIAREDDAKTLTIVSKREDDAWAKAIVREGPVDTVVEVMALVRSGPVVIEGRGPPVQFVLPVSRHVKEQANSIDHMGDHMGDHPGTLPRR